MTTVSVPKKPKAPGRRANLPADVVAAIECLFEETGRVPSMNQVALLTGIGWSTVKKYWPQSGDEEHVALSVGPEPNTEVETPLAPRGDDTAIMIDLRGHNQIKNDLVEGAMKVGNDVWRCDVLAQRNGQWIPQLYAWRVA